MTGSWWEAVSEPGALQRIAMVSVLVSARVAPLAWSIVRLFTTRAAAPLLQLLLTLVLGASLAPVAVASARPISVSGWQWLGPVARELLVGSVFAGALAVPFIAVGWAGALGDRWRGALTSASAWDAHSPLGELYGISAAVAFVLLGGHRLAVEAFAHALLELPVGAAALGGAAPSVWLQVAHLLTGALRFAFSVAAPVAIAALAVELAFGLASRVAGGISAAWLALPLRTIIGLTAAALSLFFVVGRLPAVFERALASATVLVERLGG